MGRYIKIHDVIKARESSIAKNRYHIAGDFNSLTHAARRESVASHHIHSWRTATSPSTKTRRR